MHKIKLQNFHIQTPSEYYAQNQTSKLSQSSFNSTDIKGKKYYFWFKEPYFCLQQIKKIFFQKMKEKIQQ